VALAVAQDVTERKRSEAALRRSEARYRSLIQGATYGIFRATLEGRFTDVNPALAPMLGYESEAELLALDLRADVYRDPAGYAWLAEACQRAARIDGAEVEWRRKDGQVITVRLSGRAVRNADGTLDGFEVIAEDVTERRLLEEQLRQAQKMEAVGRLAGGVAHDFNNLLTVITGYNDLMLLRLSDGHPLRPYAQETKNAADRAAALTRQLLAFSRKQVLQPKIVDPNEIVAQMEKMLRRLIGEDVDLCIVAEPALGSVEADPGQIDQVLMNLAVNARDAMPEGGRLTIETRNVGELPPGCTGGRAEASPREGGYVMLAVGDTGCGMDRDTLAHIFEPFFTTKAEGKGTGLGLATAFGIVKQSGGDVRVESEAGRGSAFRIYLPCVGAGTTARQQATTSAAPGGFETLLLVEDDETVRGLASEILRMLGYQVLEAANGPAALALCEQYGAPIDLLVTDGIMPGMNGWQLAEELFAQRPATNVLYVSGYTDRGAPLPQACFLQKPITPSMLARAVRQALGS
jgi:PAS domain S-box-containing protein